MQAGLDFASVETIPGGAFEGALKRLNRLINSSELCLGQVGDRALSINAHKGGAWQIANSYPISTEHAYY